MNFPILIFIGIILLIMGVVFIGVSITIKKHYEKLYNNCTESTIGKFDKVSERLGLNDTNDMRSYYPIFKYNVKGKDYYCKGNKGAYHIKDVDIKDITIYYNPNNPNESYTNKKTNNTIINVFKLLGIIFVVIGLCLIVLKLIV
ncbi:MAG: hypothetical protein IJE04_00550 [Bacilli bacterium]|nr:hypothetical protein [Bacilli bacterium]